LFEFGGIEDVSNRVGMQDMRSSDHWAWSQVFRAAGCVFLGKERLQGMIAGHGTLSSWKKGEMEVRE